MILNKEYLTICREKKAKRNWLYEAWMKTFDINYKTIENANELHVRSNRYYPTPLLEHALSTSQERNVAKITAIKQKDESHLI